MNWIKKQWEIDKNWQLFYPVIGVLGLMYSGYKLAGLFKFESEFLNLGSTLLIFGILYVGSVWLMRVLHRRWKVESKWKTIRIFIVFAITGSLSVFVTRPFFDWIGINRENFSGFPMASVIYFVLRFILILPFYKILLVFFGWVFNEYQFFLKFAVKLANRIGLGRLMNRFVEQSE